MYPPADPVENDKGELCAGGNAGADLYGVMAYSAHHPICPACRASELITIAMTVGSAELAFSTCHQCEARWWFRDGEQVPLSSVIGLVGIR